MYGILISAIATVSNWVFSSLILKSILFLVLFWISSEFIKYITGCGCIPTPTAIRTAFNGIPPSVWWFLNIFGFAQGVTAIFCAYMVRFLIRRIPIFG